VSLLKEVGGDEEYWRLALGSSRILCSIVGGGMLSNTWSPSEDELEELKFDANLVTCALLISPDSTPWNWIGLLGTKSFLPKTSLKLPPIFVANLSTRYSARTARFASYPSDNDHWFASKSSKKLESFINLRAVLQRSVPRSSLTRSGCSYLCSNRVPLLVRQAMSILAKGQLYVPENLINQNIEHLLIRLMFHQIPSRRVGNL
jgi:hypothetical protein